MCVCVCFCKYLRTYTSACMNTYTLHICTCIENAMLTMKTHYKSLSKRIKAKPLDPQSKWRGQGRDKPRRVGKIIRKLFALEFRIHSKVESHCYAWGNTWNYPKNLLKDYNFTCWRLPFANTYHPTPTLILHSHLSWLDLVHIPVRMFYDVCMYVSTYNCNW